ncbi:MAG: aldo/keto reductase [Ardenticatenia bacterium]|nr:aldo/keto reductase [Ardenticatenia bacterium]
MKFRRLGKTELEVPVVGIGTWQFGGEWGKRFTQQEVNRVLGRAGELGINLIDTAACYGDHLSESLIGRAIRADRERWIIATKFGHKFHGNFDRSDHWSPEEVRDQIETSLKALNTDTIDLYQFHSGSDEAFDQDDLWEMLGRQVKAGKIRHLGISISSRGDKLHQVERAAHVGAGVIQVLYNRLDRGPEEEILPLCHDQDLGVLSRVPLASGLLSGKYRPGMEFTGKDDVRSLHDKADVRRRLELVQEIEWAEVPEGVAVASWALAWCLQHAAVTCVIPGCKTVEQLEVNASAADLDMVRDDHPQVVR